MGKAVESRWSLKDLFTPKVKQAVSAVKQFTATLATADVAGKTFSKTQSAEAAALLKQKAALQEGQSAVLALKSSMVGAIPILGIGAVAAFGSAIKSATEFQSKMAYVGTLLTGTTQQVDKQLSVYSKQLEDLARSSGQSLNDLAGGLYQTLSAGVDAAHSMDVLTVATKAAIAGQTDTATAIKTTTAVLHAYGMGMNQASQVTDMMLKDVDVGNAEFSQLAQSMGLVLPSAASLHVSFGDLNATIAALTDVGLDTSSAISGLNEAFMNILKPQTSAQKEAKKLGIQFNAQALSAKGLIPFLQEIKDKTHGNTTEMAQLFGSIQGLNAMLALTSNNGMKQLISAQKEMQNSAGTTEQQYKRMTNTVATQWNRLKQAFTTRIVNGADGGLLNFIGNVLTDATQTVNFVAAHWKTMVIVISALTGQLVLFKAATTAAKLATALFGKQTAIGKLAITAYKFAIGEATGATLTFQAVSTLGIAAVVAAIVWGATHWQLVKLYAMDAWNGIVKGTQWAVNKGIDLANIYIETYKFAFDSIEFAGISIWDGILKGAQAGINALLKLISPLSGILKHVGISLPSSVNFSGLAVKATAPKFDTNFGLHHVNLSGADFAPSQIHAQAAKVQAEQNKRIDAHTKALNDNTKAISQNSQSMDSNTAASGANTKALSKTPGQDMSAEQIADKLMPRLERHLYGTMG